jgi:hypothetical protein
MSVSAKAERELEERMASRGMDVFVRIGLVLAKSADNPMAVEGLAESLKRDRGLP